jgi:mutator protein MutT
VGNLPAEKPHFHVAAGLIWKEGKVLITLRPKGSHLEGMWEFPGGKQEEEETLEACLSREMKEELGITVRPDRWRMTIDHEYESKRISLHVFDCTILCGEPRPLQGQAYRWASPAELVDFPFPPPDVKIIDLLNREGHGQPKRFE